MANYKLFFKKSVAKDFRGLPKKDVRNILNKIESLAEDPRQSGCKKLSIGELYRVRHGNYRIVYEIVDDKLIVHVIKVAHRSVAYR
jgi:mRNA interferase RelE/StbE